MPAKAPLTLLLVALSGALLPLSLAPFHLWWLGIPALAALALALHGATPKRGFLLAWAFGSGNFLVGVSWIYIAIHVYGYHPAWLAALMTTAFCLAMGLLPGLMGYVYCRWIRPGLAGPVLGFAASWVLVEWLRGWLLTGFPWLYAGYSQLNTPLAGWAPLLGIYSLSFWVALSGAAVALLCRNGRQGVLPVLACVALAGLGYSLQSVEWTRASERPPLRIGAVQSNIPQDKKWDYAQYWETLELYDRASQLLWPDSDLIIWPEAAIPSLYHHATPFFDYIRDQAQAQGSALISGVPTRNGDDLYNSVIVVAGGEGIYNKQRLVPFGEYVPLREYLGGLITLFDLPLSSFSRGEPDQALLEVKGWKLSASICYEIVYPDLIGRSAGQADVLFTISNDGWFGDSIGPAQHMQMAQMRALENGRELIRITSTGITGIVDHRGQLQQRLPSFQQANLQGQVQAREGQTPFSRFGSSPIIGFCALLAALALFTRRRPGYSDLP